MLPLVLKADPTFGPAWLGWVIEWADEPEAPGYAALGLLADHLVAQLARGETARFPAVFDVVERWHVEGDQYVRVAATIGLLEGLQNTSRHERTRPGDFEPWLQPVSRMFWDKVARFWSHGEIITEDS